MSTNTTGRSFPVGAVALLGAALALVAVVLAFGGTAQAQVDPAHRAADLHITKTVKPKSVPLRDPQTFDIRVTNERGSTARGVVVRDPLPRAVKFVRASTSRHDPGSCRKVERTVRCKLGKLRVDRTVTVKIVVKPIERGEYLNRAYVEQTRTAELQASDNIDGARARATRR